MSDEVSPAAAPRARLSWWAGRIAARAAGILLLMLVVLGVLGGGAAWIDSRHVRIIDELGVNQRGQTQAVDDYATSIFGYSGLLTAVVLGELRPAIAARRVARHVELMAGHQAALLSAIGPRLDPILVGTVTDMMERMPALGEEMSRAFAADDRARQAALNEVWRTRAVTFTSLVREARRVVQAEADRNVDAAHRLAVRSRVITLSGLALGLLGLLLTWLVLVRQTARPLAAVAGAMDQLAQGRADVPVPHATRRDQVGDMARTVLVFRENLRHGQRLGEQALDGARRTAVATNQASDAIGQISDGAMTQLAELRQLAEALGQSGEAIREVGRLTHGSQDRTEAVRSLLASSLGHIASLLEVVQAVGEDTARVTRIAATIGKVATQTNILAINAAIEAARAGEHGRGLAVVAEEVRALAANTEALAEEIGEVVLQAGGRAREGAETATTVGGAMDRLEQLVGETARLAGATAIAMEQQQATVESIAGRVEVLTRIGQSNATAAEEITVTMIDLSRLAAETREAVESVASSTEAAGAARP